MTVLSARHVRYAMTRSIYGLSTYRDGYVTPNYTVRFYQGVMPALADLRGLDESTLVTSRATDLLGEMVVEFKSYSDIDRIQLSTKNIKTPSLGNGTISWVLVSSESLNADDYFVSDSIVEAGTNRGMVTVDALALVTGQDFYLMDFTLYTKSGV